MFLCTSYFYLSCFLSLQSLSQHWMTSCVVLSLHSVICLRPKVGCLLWSVKKNEGENMLLLSVLLLLDLLFSSHFLLFSCVLSSWHSLIFLLVLCFLLRGKHVSLRNIIDFSTRLNERPADSHHHVSHSVSFLYLLFSSTLKNILFMWH